MLVKEVMTSSPICCKPGDSLARVAQMMAEHDCGVVPVVSSGKLIGIVTDRDITCRAIGAGKTPADVPVSEVMSQPVVTVGQNEDVQVAIDCMKEKQVRRLPVVDDTGKITGIVAPSDLAPTFASMDVADFLLAVSYWSRKPHAA
ncbi:MAG TPA: CBS domain-containing protein [Vicinamibacterales bacterium]